MRTFRGLAFAVGLSVLTLAALPAMAADSDPTMDQVYTAARSGQLAEAQSMMAQVLRDHPTSAKAHYVAAEIDARGGNMPQAQQELTTAERLAPGLPFVQSVDVQALQRQISQGAAWRAAPAAPRSASPWGGMLLLVSVCVIVGVLWALRRRSRYAPSYMGPMQMGPGAPMGMSGPMYPGPMYPGYGPMGGSGVLGSLASGLAVGAGVAAGEQLVHHMLDSNNPTGGVISSADAADWNGAGVNSDMGGADFGVSDPGSWGDSGAGGGGFDDLGGGGGGDWT